MRDGMIVYREQIHEVGREISTVLMPISFSVPASTTEDDIRKMVFLRIAKDHPQLIEYIC